MFSSVFRILIHFLQIQIQPKIWKRIRKAGQREKEKIGPPKASSCFGMLMEPGGPIPKSAGKNEAGRKGPPGGGGGMEKTPGGREKVNFKQQ